MSDPESSRQSDNITPAEGNAVLAITLDGAAHIYDLNALAFGAGSAAPGAKGTQGADAALQANVFLKLIADVDFYVFFYSDNSLTIDNAAAGAAATVTPSGFTPNACDLVAAKTPEHVRINRKRHRFMYIKGSAAGILRVRASSQASAAAQALL